MAKVRIYELAQELKLGVKELLDNLKELGFEVKSHLSFLEKEEVEWAKQKLLLKGSDQIVEKRTGSTIIRRRVKKIEPETSVLQIQTHPVEEKDKEEEVSPIVEKKEIKKRIWEPREFIRPSLKRVVLRKEELPKRFEKRYSPGKSASKLVEKRPLSQEIKAPRPLQKPQITTPKLLKRKIKVFEVITVGELAKKMGVKVGEVIKKLMEVGAIASINQSIDLDVASLVAGEFGYEIESASVEEEEVLEAKEDLPEKLLHRFPVVTIMGHVDHGKTSLLDAIRHTNLIEKETGGITQHIGAYEVKLEKGEVIFLDTPGHEAFTAMRARGAQVTDIVVLVVAADDGVMSQTIEAINHAKAAKVPIIVAINKIDKAQADPEMVRRQLAENGLVPEEWGGDTLFVEVSAKKRQGIKELLELILLQAEVLELKANLEKRAKGTVIEARLDEGRGPMATVLIQEGTLVVGDAFLSGIHFGRVRAMINKGEKVARATPSMPVEVLGFPGVPQAGDSFVVISDERRARQISIHRQKTQWQAKLSKSGRVGLQDLYSNIQSGKIKELNLIIKGDVQGSVEALRESFRNLEIDTIKVNFLHTFVGDPSESDIMLAAASNAIIIGFNVKPDSKIISMAEREGVEIKLYNVIYDAISEVKRAMEGLLEPILQEKVLGRAEVRALFNIPKVGVVAGSYVTEGKILRNYSVRVIRDNTTFFEGRILSLKHFKDDIKEAPQGYECGIALEGWKDFKEGDIIESYIVEKISARLQ